MIVHLHATPANVHDSQVISPLLSDEEDAGKRLFADSAYGGRPQIEEIESFGMIPEVCEKGTRGKPLTEEQKESNRIKSKTRCRIEHVFGYIQIVFGGSFVRSVGIKRATAYQWAPPWPTTSFAWPLSSARPYSAQRLEPPRWLRITLRRTDQPSPCQLLPLRGVFVVSCARAIETLIRWI